jgi:pimeloyl-ACP methyl ester carboxylesterase
MPIAVRNGVAFHLQELGEGGSPVIMLHGLLVGSLATWYFTAAPTLARAHRVLLYDLRGHGKSERAKTGYDPWTMAADLGAIVDGFTSDPVTLVGHSYGAVVALRWALDNPGRVAKLAIVEAPLPPGNLAELDSFLGRSPDAMADALPGVLRDALGRRGRQAAKLVDSLRFLATESSLFADLRTATDIDDETLRSMRCPVLSVYGTQSSCLAVGRRLARVLPEVTSLEVEGGHFLPIEAPAEVTRALVAFVGGEPHG